MEYFVFDEELWQEGQCFQCKIKQDSLFIESKEIENKKAVYISDCLDSGEKETLWHRMSINYQKVGESLVSISYFAIDNLEIMVNNQKMLLPEFLKNNSFSQEEKLYILQPYWQETKKEQKDILLFEAKGQYFYFKIEVLIYKESNVNINQLHIYFPRENITDYLPAFYNSDHKNNSFLKRFLAVFHTMLFDVQQKIDTVSEYFIPDVLTGANLQWLANCMAMPESIFWNEQITIQFLKKGFLLYQKKGTKEGISLLVELYTGKKPFIVETYEILQNSLHTAWEKEYTELYGKDIYKYYIFVEQQYLSDYRKYGELKNLLEVFQPAHTKAELVVLHPFIVFGEHCYMGINSCLLGSTALELDGTTILPFQTTLLE